jgi:hypothetical protein
MSATYSQFTQWLAGLWQSPGFPLFAAAATSVLSMFGMLLLWGYFRLHHKPGMHYTPEAAQWASQHFPESSMISALLLEQGGLTWEDLSKVTNLRGDLLMTEFEVRAFHLALAKDLQVEIPAAEARALRTIQDVVEYLERRVEPEGTGTSYRRGSTSSGANSAAG